MPRQCLLFIVLLLTTYSSPGAYRYVYSDDCKRAYVHYLSLRLDEGNAAIRQAITADPQNLLPVYIADYEDCLLLLFNGDKADYAQRRSHMEERLALLEKGDRASPWYRLSKAGIYLHWALIYIRFGENLKAASAFRKSYVLLRENKKQHPGFDYNDVFLGFEEAAIGTIPDDFRWIAAIFGMKGNVKAGVSQLRRFISNHSENDILYRESVLYDCYLRFYLVHQQPQVWEFIADNFNDKTNVMHLFFKANFALNYRKADIALECLRQAMDIKAYKKFPVFDYEMALALLLKLDPDALFYYKRFITNFRGKIFVKESWQNMAYMHYILNNAQQAANCRRQIKNTGSLLVDSDKQAQRFSDGTEWPDKEILKARLLMDGGNYQAAFTVLRKIEINDLVSMQARLEYYFRLGRVNEEMNDDATALRYYAQVISTGKNRKEYFAARSALHSAFIYERSKNYTKAINMFNECLSMKGHDFKNSIDQQAKAGISRLGN